MLAISSRLENFLYAGYVFPITKKIHCCDDDIDDDDDEGNNNNSNNNKFFSRRMKILKEQMFIDQWPAFLQYHNH